jgi:hypothetical protein
MRSWPFSASLRLRAGAANMAYWYSQQRSS